MVNFVLSALESSVALDLSANVYTSSIPELSSDATGVFYINKEAIKNIFKYQTDSFDTIDDPSSDIKYYVDYAAFTGLGLNPANVMLDVSGLSLDPIASADQAGSALPRNKMLLAHDFLRHVAKDLFGTHLGVDIFNNEKDLIKDIRSVCSDVAEGNVMYEINAAVKKVSTTSTETVTGLEGSTGSKYMTNANADPENLGRVLFGQLWANVPNRFANIQSSALAQSLPFEADDSVSFKLTVSAAANQHKLTRDSGDVASRSYKIKLVVVEDKTGLNTVPADDEA